MQKKEDVKKLLNNLNKSTTTKTLKASSTGKGTAAKTTARAGVKGINAKAATGSKTSKPVTARSGKTTTPCTNKMWPSRPAAELNPYKKNNAYPGSNYFLVGNSFNLEQQFTGTMQAQRTSAVAGMLKKRGHCEQLVTVKDALKDHNFVNTLSRFERDLLKLLPEGTVIGPAYDRRGVAIGYSFAIWRPMATNVVRRTPAKTSERPLARAGKGR